MRREISVCGFFRFKGGSMNEIEVVEELICPWCYSLIEVINEDDAVKCSVCERIVTEEDLEEVKEN